MLNVLKLLRLSQKLKKTKISKNYLIAPAPRSKVDQNFRKNLERSKIIAIIAKMKKTQSAFSKPYQEIVQLFIKYFLPTVFANGITGYLLIHFIKYLLIRLLITA